MAFRSCTALKNYVKLLNTHARPLGQMISVTKPRLCQMTTDSNNHDINKQAKMAWSQSSVSDIYEKSRPDYNPEAVKFLLEKLGALEHGDSDEFVIVELGAGTGKFTRAMLRTLNEFDVKNVKIIATEPVGQMCEKFKTILPDIDILECPASKITLPDVKASAVVAAQSFHWFSTKEAVNEIYRILKPQGTLGIIWNLPDHSVPWINTVETMLLEKYKQNNIPRPEATDEWLMQVNNHGGFGDLNENDTFKYVTTHNWESLLQRFKSVSVVAAAEPEERERMIQVFKDAVTKYNEKKTEYHFHYNIWIKWFNKLN